MSQNDHRNRRGNDQYGSDRERDGGGYGYESRQQSQFSPSGRQQGAGYESSYQHGSNFDRGYPREQDRAFERSYQPGNSAYETAPEWRDAGRRDFDRDLRGYRNDLNETSGYGSGYGRDEAANWGAQRQARQWDARSTPQARQHHDPDYQYWRDEQIRALDSDYDSWRQERYSRFSDDFNKWRSERATQANKQDTKNSGNDKQK